MKRNTKFGFLIVLLLTTTISCQKEELEFVDKQTGERKEEAPSSKMKENGKKLKNPYSVENMKKALAKVKEKNGNKMEGSEQYIIIDNDYTIETSHHYLKFEPQTEEEIYEMKRDSTLVLFDYPLDVEFSDAYLDSRTSSDPNAIPFYYTAVPVEEQPTTTLSPLLLEELYIPEEDPYFDEEMRAEGKAPKGDKEELMKRLLKEAFILTENESEWIDVISGGEANNQTKSLLGTRWTPSGNIQIWDNTFSGETTQIFSHYEYYPCNDETTIQDPTQPAEIMPIDGGGSGTCQRAVYKSVETDGKYVPLEGAQVLMRQWFTIRQGITDSNGNFTTRSLKGNARYIIQWERHQYSIRSGWYGQAETRGPKVKEQAWVTKLKGDKHQYYGMIHRAAHNYYYGPIDGLRRPPENTFWRKQMKIGAYDVNGANYHTIYTDWIPGNPWPRINIKSYGRKDDAIFGTVTHELSHATNARRSSPVANFIGSEERMKETYAQTIEWYITTKYYKKYNSNYEFDGNYQYRYKNRPNSKDNIYTSFMVDLIDENNQYEIWGFPYPPDDVENYTINQIENEVMDNPTFYSFKNALKNNYSNITSQHVDKLYNYWN